MSRVDILNLEWSSRGRDIHIVEPVLCFLEKKGYMVTRTSYLFALLKIIFFRPKMLIVSNNTGSVRNFIATKFAYLLGIKVVSLVSEGDYCITDSENNTIDSFFWGWDINKEFPIDLHLEWSHKNLDLLNLYCPDIKKYIYRIRVSGATGFDRYKLFEFERKEDFLDKYKLGKYDKVVGYATWGFDCLYDYAFTNADTFNHSLEYINFHKKNRDLLKEILTKIISNNPDVLFILKRHPGELIYEETELAGLEKEENVIVFKDEETIEDLINICDLWLAYESTTCLEAWLLNKQTVLINPIEFQDNRSEISHGSPVVTNYDDLQRCIDSGHISGFDELNETRNNLITKIIEHSDGKNYIRAGNYIIEEFGKENCRNMTLPWWSIKMVIKEILKAMIFYSPLRYILFFNKYIQDCNEFAQIYSNMEREEYVKQYKKVISVVK